MHGHVACVPDVLRLLPHDLGHERTKGGLAEVGVQVRDLRRVQRPLDLVDTLDQTLQRMPCMEAGGPRVAIDVALRITSALRRMRELLLQGTQSWRRFPLRLRGLPERRGIAGRRRECRVRLGGRAGWPFVVRRIRRWQRSGSVHPKEVQGRSSFSNRLFFSIGKVVDAASCANLALKNFIISRPTGSAMHSSQETALIC